MAIVFRWLGCRDCLVAALLWGLVASALADALPRFHNVDTSKITVSGVSAGGAMAIQLGVAYSDRVTGVGAIAAPPYLCAWDSQTRATSICTQFQKEFFKSVGVPANLVGEDHPVDVQSIIDDAEQLAGAQEKFIAPTTNIGQQKVWLFRGFLDELGPSESAFDASIQFYRNYKAHLQILRGRQQVATRSTNHTMPTDKEGLRSCSEIAKPDFISSCHFPAASVLLSYLYGDNAVKAGQGRLVKFDQHLYTIRARWNESAVERVAPSEIAMADTGWVFVPDSCDQGGACRVHVALHGCAQSDEYVRPRNGYLFFEQAGYNEWAAGHDIIVLYPQTATDPKKVPEFVGVAPNRTNPFGCFDWWGETNYDDPRFGLTAYATRVGPQMMTIMNMVDALKRY